MQLKIKANNFNCSNGFEMMQNSPRKFSTYFASVVIFTNSKHSSKLALNHLRKSKN